MQYYKVHGWLHLQMQASCWHIGLTTGYMQINPPSCSGVNCRKCYIKARTGFYECQKLWSRWGVILLASSQVSLPVSWLLSEETRIRHRSDTEDCINHSTKGSVSFLFLPKSQGKGSGRGRCCTCNKFKTTSLRNWNLFLMHYNQTSPMFALEEDMIIFWQ